jgi:hypothetical protein
MMEQPQECYGIPYAMHVHDIGNIHKVYEAEVNECLYRGEKLLAISPEGNSEYGIEPVYVFGIPRQKECLIHAGVIKEYVHISDVWMCPECNKPVAQEPELPAF